MTDKNIIDQLCSEYGDVDNSISVALAHGSGNMIHDLLSRRKALELKIICYCMEQHGYSYSFMTGLPLWSKE